MQENNQVAGTAEMTAPARYVARFFDWLEAKGRFGMPAFAFLVGVVLSRAFPPLNFFPGLLIAFPLMLVMIDRAKSRGAAFAYGWWTGFGFFSVGLTWIGHSFTQQDAIPAILAPFAITALSAILAIYIGIVFWITYRLRSQGLFRMVVFASAWVMFEFARGTWFTGFPWNLIGTAWANWLPVAQASYYIGAHGLVLSPSWQRSRSRA